MSGPFGTGAFGTSAFSSSPLFSTKDIIDSVLRDTGHSDPAVETNKRAMVVGYVNNRYARVSTSRHWDWLFQTVDVNLDEPYETGAVDLVNGSGTVTGVGTLFSSNELPNAILIPTARNERYAIESVESDTSLTLEGEYAGDDVDGAGYRIVKPMLTLPGDCEHVQSAVVGGVGKLVPIGRQEMSLKVAGDPSRVGPPHWFTEVGRRSDGVRIIMVYPSPDRKYVVALNYGVNIQKLEDAEDNFPLIPDRHRVVLYYGALAEMYRYLSEPEKASTAERDFQMAQLAMQNDSQLTDSKFTLQPKRNYRNRRAGRRYKVFMDRYDFGRED